jgi:hypothetical protein
MPRAGVNTVGVQEKARHGALCLPADFLRGFPSK